MFLKLTHPDGSCNVLDRVTACRFPAAHDSNPIAIVTLEDGTAQEHCLAGNAYLMNADGVTFERFILP